MNDKFLEIKIPLVSFSVRESAEIFDANGNLLSVESTVKVLAEVKLSGKCYAVKVVDRSMTPHLEPGKVALFGEANNTPALHNIFSIGVKNGNPLIRKILKNESGVGGQNLDSHKTGNNPPTSRRTKSFMTPTPLHMPDSTVSPIPDSAHKMVLLCKTGGAGGASAVPANEILWMHPLLYILKLKN